MRSGLTYRPESVDGVFTLGYANIRTGAFGDSSRTTGEDRIYQEALLPQKLGSRIYLRHRFRYEQRWVENQDFRTRFRYALFANIPLNQEPLGRGAWYLSLYNEIFLNGERDIGDGREVEIYDRNRLYGAIGHSLRDNLKLQFGYMYQDTDTIAKGQLQFSLQIIATGPGPFPTEAHRDCNRLVIFMAVYFAVSTRPLPDCTRGIM